jgi:hypothetical protein
MPATAGRIVDLGAEPQNLAFRKFADIGADVLEQLGEDLCMARFVPDLTRHVELEFPWRVRKIEQRASCRFHRLHFPGGDPVKSPLEEVFFERHHVVRQQSLVDPRLADAFNRHHDVIVRAREPVNRNHLLHSYIPSNRIPRN